jgi:hypothetical protein
MAAPLLLILIAVVALGVCLLLHVMTWSLLRLLCFTWLWAILAGCIALSGGAIGVVLGLSIGGPLAGVVGQAVLAPLLGYAVSLQFLWASVVRRFTSFAAALDPNVAGSNWRQWFGGWLGWPSQVPRLTGRSRVLMLSSFALALLTSLTIGVVVGRVATGLYFGALSCVGIRGLAAAIQAVRWYVRHSADLDAQGLRPAWLRLPQSTNAGAYGRVRHAIWGF